MKGLDAHHVEMQLHGFGASVSHSFKCVPVVFLWKSGFQHFQNGVFDISIASYM